MAMKIRAGFEPITPSTKEVVQVCNIIEPYLQLNKREGFAVQFSEQVFQLYRDFKKFEKEPSFAYKSQSAHPAYQVLLKLRKQAGSEIKAINTQIKATNERVTEREAVNAKVKALTLEAQEKFFDTLVEIEAEFFENENNECTLSARRVLVPFDAENNSDWHIQIRSKILSKKSA